MNFSAPSYVPIEITSKCNLKCEHCYGSFPRTDKKDMSLKEIEIIVMKLYRAGVFRFEIGGGEPSLRDDFVDVLKLFDKLNDVEIAVVSNGSNYTENDIQAISNINNHFIFHISMDGYDEKSYSFLRGDPQMFHKALNTTKLMIKHKIDVRWNFALGKNTIEFLPHVISLAEKTGVRIIRIMVLYNTGRAFVSKEGLNYSEYQCFLKRFFDGEYYNNNVNVSLALTQPFEAFVPLLELGLAKETIDNILNYKSCMDDPLYKKMSNCSCMAGRNIAAVDSEGYMHYCCMLTGKTDNIGGNLIREDFHDIWDKSIAFNWIRNIQIEDLHTNCYECKHKDICGGGCRARALALTGDFLGPDPLCPLCEYREKEAPNITNNLEERINDLPFTFIMNKIAYRVRPEIFGGTVFSSSGNYYYINEKGYILLKLLCKYKKIEVVYNVIKKKNVDFEANQLYDEYEQLIKLLNS